MKRGLLLGALGLVIVVALLVRMQSRAPTPEPEQIPTPLPGSPAAATSLPKPKALDVLDARSTQLRRVQELRKSLPKSETPDRKAHSTAQAEFFAARRIEGSDPAEAKRRYEAIVEKEPWHEASLEALADMQIYNDREKALEYALRCLAVNETNPTCHRTVVALYTIQGDWDAAEPYLLDCLDLSPGNIHCLSALASMSFARGDLDTAKKTVSWMELVDRESVFTQVAVGDLASMAGDIDAAVAAFDYACERGQSYACGRVRELRARQ